MSNPRSTRRNIPENLSSKHEIGAISLVKEEAAYLEGDEDKENKHKYLNFLSSICCV